jgi:hypothetical protein
MSPTDAAMSPTDAAAMSSGGAGMAAVRAMMPQSGSDGAGASSSAAPAQKAHRLKRSRSVDANFGSTLKGQGTELWSGGKMLPPAHPPLVGKYESLEDRACVDATNRFGHTLEMGFGSEEGFNKYGAIKGEVRQTLAPWDQNDASTQAPWLDLSSQIAQEARGMVHATVNPDRTAGLLAPSAREGAGPRVAGQQDKGGVFWGREFPELSQNSNISSLQMINAESGDRTYIPRSGGGGWEAPDTSRGNK